MSENSDLLSTKQAAKYLGVSVQWLKIHRFDDVGPPWIALGGLRKYRKSSLEKWLAEREGNHVMEAV